MDETAWNEVITARIRRMTEGNVFTLSTIAWGTPFPGLDRGGIRKDGSTPPPRLGRMGYPPTPSQEGWGTPPPIQTWEWGTHTPPPPVQVRSQDGETPNRNSVACTCYVAGGIPLAFTQGDFLVVIILWRGLNSGSLCLGGRVNVTLC